MKTKRRVMSRVKLPWTPADGRGSRRVSTMVDPMKAPAPGNRLPFRRGSVEYCLGTEADHEAVYQTLLHVFHGPDRESFLGALSDPVYGPDQRLLAKVDGRIVSHLHLTDRQLRYGSVSIPVNGVMWVGTLPEFRGMGFAQNLVRLASQRARDKGVCPAGLDDRHAAILPAAGLGYLRPADVRADDEPKLAPGERRDDRGSRGRLARPAVAAGRAGRSDGALRPAILADHGHDCALRGILAVDDRPQVRSRDLGRLPG